MLLVFTAALTMKFVRFHLVGIHWFLSMLGFGTIGLDTEIDLSHD